MLKKTLIGKVISTVHERFAKFKARLFDAEKAWVSQEEGQLLEECYKETGMLLSALKDTYRREKEGASTGSKTRTAAATPQEESTPRPRIPHPKAEEEKVPGIEKQRNEKEAKDYKEYNNKDKMAVKGAAELQKTETAETVAPSI